MMMKKMLLMLLVAFATQFACAQQAQKVFDAFRSEKKAEYTSVPGVLMALAGDKVKDNNVAAVLKEVKSARVLRLGNCKKRTRKKFAQQVAALSKEGYEEYARTKQGDSDLLVMIKKDDELISEIITCVYSDSNCVGVLVKGNINVGDGYASFAYFHVFVVKHSVVVCVKVSKKQQRVLQHAQSGE